MAATADRRSAATDAARTRLMSQAAMIREEPVTKKSGIKSRRAICSPLTPAARVNHVRWAHRDRDRGMSPANATNSGGGDNGRG